MSLNDKDNYAAIDIGSNAIRLLIAHVEELSEFTQVKKLSLTRVPIRLGEDAFGAGKISDFKENAMIKTMQSFKLLMEVYGIKRYRACATSAMREAKNSKKIIEAIKYHTGIEIELIDGKIEANLIFNSLFTYALSKKGSYLFVDVGGGSTEITVFKKGKRVNSKSFKIGTVRALQGKEKEETWSELDKYLDKLKKQDDNYVAVGTGGNINRYFKISNKPYLEPLKYNELKAIYDDIAPLSIMERVQKYYLRYDRADVIEPAGKIYLTIMKKCGIEDIIVPKVGLTDGIVYQMYKEDCVG